MRPDPLRSQRLDDLDAGGRHREWQDGRRVSPEAERIGRVLEAIDVAIERPRVQRFWQKLKSIENLADKLLGIDADEKKAHETVRKNRARLINSLLEAYGDVCADIERIIGTADLE